MTELAAGSNFVVLVQVDTIVCSRMEGAYSEYGAAYIQYKGHNEFVSLLQEKNDENTTKRLHLSNYIVLEKTKCRGGSPVRTLLDSNRNVKDRTDQILQTEVLFVLCTTRDFKVWRQSMSLT